MVPCKSIVVVAALPTAVAPTTPAPAPADVPIPFKVTLLAVVTVKADKETLLPINPPTETVPVPAVSVRE